MTRIVSEVGALAATNCGPRARLRRGWLARTLAVSALCGLFPIEGCSYIFSEKRTVYQFDPAYGVDSPQFLRSLDGLGTEMVSGNQAVQTGGGIYNNSTLLVVNSTSNTLSVLLTPALPRAAAAWSRAASPAAPASSARW